MASVDNLNEIRHAGWFQGFGNLVRKENHAWWHTRKWWINSLVWIAIINGFVAILLWVVPIAEPEEAIPIAEATQLFVGIFGVFASIGVIVIAQGVIVGEKQTGTAQWLMSNPVTHSAFILSKLAANGLAVLIIIVIMQSVLFYGQISLRETQFLPIVPFIKAIALVTLNLIFFLTLTIMTGTFFASRGPVIGISIAVLIGQDIAAQLLADPLPWLPTIVPQRLLDYAQMAIIDQPIPSFTPIILLSSLSVVFVLLSIWRFSREEF